MALDLRYYLFFSFEQYFVDKVTGLPLANGYIKFFRDSARSTPKNVYILTGSPPSYSYLSIGATVNLTGYGVPVYSNNNVALYGFPFEGNPSDNNANQDLYYYEVYSEDDVLQFTREGQPNVSAESTAESINNNYVPNGQFFWHNDVPASAANAYVEGKITENITVVGQGGWTFERTTGTNVVDIVTFERINSLTSNNPPDNPRYQIRINTQDSTGGGAYKDLRLKFDSVNKFQSFVVPPQQYTYTFNVDNNEITTIENVEVRLIKNYGTGGTPSPEQDVNIGTFDITPTATQISITFDFGSNVGKTLGTNDDDYLQLAIRLPGAEEFNVLFTDFGLFTGTLSDEFIFAATTDNQFTYQALAGNITVTDYAQKASNDLTLKQQNANLFLIPVLKATGLDFDRSSISRVESFSSYNAADWDSNDVHVSTNLVLPFGQQFETADYSPLRIPWSRLQEKYWDSTNLVPIHGTGLNFMTATIPAGDNVLLINNNSEAAVTNAADVNTGFTITTIHKETATYFMKSYNARSALNAYADNELYIENKNYGAVTAITANTSGFVVGVVQTGSTILPEISFVRTTAASGLADPGNPGHYFKMQSINGVPAAVSWYVWYQVSTETDPAPGGTGIKINLNSTDSEFVVAQKTWQALNGWQETQITTAAASSLTAGDYFTINSAGPLPEAYYVWYQKDGSGTDPAPANKIGILVNVASADTAIQVASKTLIAMNMKYFAMPDYRGYFFRVWDDGIGNDPDARERHSYVREISGDVLGTFQLSGNIEHLHDRGNIIVVQSGAGSNVISTGSGAANTGLTGGHESRSINKNVLVAIRY